MTMDGADPFALLGLPRRFRLSPTEVQVAHLRRLAHLHPDRVQDPVERIEAARAAAMLNQARSILEDEEQRANALLVLLGGAAPESDRSLPDGFLLEMMEVRERIEEAISSDDAAKRDELVAWAADERRRLLEEAGARLDAASATSEAERSEPLRQARLTLNALRYFERLLEQVRDGAGPGL